MSLLDQLLKQSRLQHKPVVAVAAAADKAVLEAVQKAIEENIGSFLLFDDESKLQELLSAHFPSLTNDANIRIHHTENMTHSAAEAVKAVSSGEAHVLMKGNVASTIILKEVLHKEYGLRSGKVLSHVAAFEMPGYERLLFVTDAAMNIAPNLTEKVQIVENAVATAHACGVTNPIVAPLAAVESVNAAMEATIDAAALAVMNKRGQIAGCTIEGPLALDNAISPRAAKQKGIESEVAGRADILVPPTIEAANILYKSFMYFGNAKVGAIIQGAAAPIVLTSRADSAESKYYSLGLAILTAKTANDQG
ncbi:phosphate butyryltransferase [Sporosarcina sp. HYO08]|uniref:phosphate butyryltransferase n=1 Tax=Sporosarcina sp. HYO08 TaxID=1759557 RepID=UPI000799DCA1|nr:phosphate butyryltransferase [Sporosarcina sp. HYO08]KXH87498.1 phosphate butyryltransferase [Sporosarcina sp. HYO08]